MKRPWEVWSAFAICLTAVAVAVGWLSWRALVAERAESAARQQATLEENVRLALWRMDSALAVLLAQENARPFDAYLPKPNGEVATGMPVPAAGLSVAPPPGPHVQIYFHESADGRLLFPQIPSGLDASRANVTSADVPVRERVAALQKLIRFDDLSNRLPPPTQVDEAASPPIIDNTLTPPGELPADQRLQQKARGTNEYRARSQYVMENNIANNGTLQNFNTGMYVLPFGSPGPQVGILSPVVLSDGLFLARRATAGGQNFIQGAWLDWSVIHRDLLDRISDLLPAATLSIHDAESSASEPGHLLASLPVRLDPGPAPIYPVGGLSPVRLSLIVAWGAMFLAALAVAILLRGVVALSERRADFVSAVTHELRTPLTTFRMYAEMLAEGMVDDEFRRRQYLDTLRIEADRLTHLVENVLAYARLERGGLGNRIQSVTVEQLLSAATTRLADRASQADFDLSVDVPPSAAAARVLADPSAVEQILFNLVDNACKYAVRANPQLIELEARLAADRFFLRVRDHGPGVSRTQQTRLFQSFRKSADQAAASAPGVGLGLSLSRRLARDMRGDLRYDCTIVHGAVFELQLPLAPVV